jgi:hypothetical protein
MCASLLIVEAVGLSDNGLIRFLRSQSRHLACCAVIGSGLTPTHRGVAMSGMTGCSLVMVCALLEPVVVAAFVVSD